MSGKLPNRIASEDLEGCNAWSLPMMDGSGRVIPSAQKERKQRVEELVEEVEEDTVEYQPLTADELQAITDAAEEDGYKAGHEEGYTKGLAEGREKGFELGQQEAEVAARRVLDAQVERLESVVTALLEPLRTQEDQIRQVLLQYVILLTRQVVQRELTVDSSVITNVLKEALQALPVGASNIRVALHPDDLELVQQYSKNKHLSLEFRPSEDVTPGGCQLQSEYSFIDFSVESRLQSMFEQFLQQGLSGGNTEEADALRTTLEEDAQSDDHP